MVEDAPLLLRRLWSDLRRGDTQVFRELIRRGVQLQLFMVVLYILSPVSGFLLRLFSWGARCVDVDLMLALNPIMAGAGAEESSRTDLLCRRRMCG